MFSRILLLILSFSITLCLASCAKVIKVDIQEVGEKSFVIRAHDAFWRKRVCIDFVSIQKSADIFGLRAKIANHAFVPIVFTIQMYRLASKSGKALRYRDPESTAYRFSATPATEVLSLTSNNGNMSS